MAKNMAEAFVISLCLVIEGCDSMLCGYQGKIEFPSPDGKTIAAVYEYDCGATTPFAMRVNLRPRWFWFNPRSDVVFLVKYQSPIRVIWNNNREISIECENCVQGNIFKAENRWKDVTIRYRPQQVKKAQGVETHAGG